MCLILIAHEPNARYRLVLAANRDEFYERPTAPAAFWDDAPDVLAGRDLRRGGTWMGVTIGGKVAAVTNFRGPEGRERREKAPSRGHLVSAFVQSDESPARYLEGLRRHARNYDGFNLLVGDAEGLWWYSNRGEEPRELSPGVYGLSNHLLDTPWPKVERGKRALVQLLAGQEEVSPERIFPILADRTPGADRELPDTGVGLELERLLSAPFIRARDYGTRSSTVLLVERTGNATFVERRFRPDSEAGGEGWDEIRHRFPIEP